MTSDISTLAGLWLGFLAEWSLRWGAMLAGLALALALRPPRSAVARYALCSAVLVAGVLIPFSPRWGPGLVAGPRPVSAAPPAQAAPLPPAPRALERKTFVAADRFAGRTHEAITPPSSLPPSPPTRAPWSVRPILLPTCAMFWAVVVVALLARLGAGCVALSRLRRGAVALGERSQQLLDESRAALGVRRSARLATHPTISSPVALGGLRPLVLVPTDWETWPETARRACLLHELAHLARHDDWAKLAQELVRAPFFFHPLVHWLLDRLDRERELLCDEAVVAHDVDPLAYARVLLTCAQRPGRIAARVQGLPFLSRGTIRLRIQRLMEDDMAQSIAPFSTRSALAVGAVALAAALGLGGLRVRTLADEPREKPDREAPRAPLTQPAPSDDRLVKGTILDADGAPVAGATVVAGLRDTGTPNHRVLTTDKDGHVNWTAPLGKHVASIYVAKDGWAPAVWMEGMRSEAVAEFELRLAKAEGFEAVLVDPSDKPVAGARVGIEIIAHGSHSQREGGGTTTTCYTYIDRDILAGSPLEHLFVTTTDDAGRFSFHTLPPSSWLKLAVTTPDGRALRVKARGSVGGAIGQMMTESGFVAAAPGESARLLAAPAARVDGRVVSRVPGVSAAGRRVFYQASRANDRVPLHRANESGLARTDEAGRFSFDSLNEGTINIVVVPDGDHDPWTYRAAKDVVLKSGVASEVSIELIRGVEIEGTVVAQGSARPVVGAQLGAYGPSHPRSSAMCRGAETDAEGRYHYRLPAGETYFYVMGPPSGYARLPEEGSSRTVTIPEGVTSYTVPPIELAAAAAALNGRVLDAQGKPIAGAKIVGVCDQFRCMPLNQPSAVTNERGEFRLSQGPAAVAVGQATHLQVRLPGGQEHQLALRPEADGAVTLKVPTADLPDVQGPRDVAPDELAGVVVDTEGRPIEGVDVDAWDWFPGNETKTDAKGQFRVGKLEANRKVEVRFRKDGYTPQLFLTQPTGQAGWVVVLGNRTYFEGRVTSPDGQPVPDALIRANNGPKEIHGGGRITEIWTETRSGADGRYRLYAQSDVYDIQVRVPGVGVARLPGTVLATDEAKHLDIALNPGVAFRARVVDSLTGTPVAGVRLWQHRGIEARSDDQGMVAIDDMLPGRFDFQVEAAGYARWWSNDAVSEWNRFQKEERLGGWQRNFDYVDFDLKPGMEPVKIILERGVKVTGRVLDPDGKPVAGATVAPALTGTGNSLTGDTRFSVETDAKGRFEMLLPASGDRNYNLVAHDGKYQQWRNWANGVLPPFRTQPGEEVRDVELPLTRPATVVGHVLDRNGRPIADREVRASAADLHENRYYDPTTRTRADGTFELRFVRPGEQHIQVAPFWFSAVEAPEGTSQTVVLAPGESKARLEFKVDPNGEVR